jgi:prefoldin subunit 2
MRLVGGVLCERTIKEVLPSVQENEVRIAQVIDRLSEDLKKKEAALAEFKKEHGIVVRGEETKA